jgi:hypothetical protein
VHGGIAGQQCSGLLPHAKLFQLIQQLGDGGRVSESDMRDCPPCRVVVCRVQVVERLDKGDDRAGAAMGNSPFPKSGSITEQPSGLGRIGKGRQAARVSETTSCRPEVGWGNMAAADASAMLLKKVG